MINKSFFILFLWNIPSVAGHGRLIEPPSRSSAWRFGFDTPKEYDDNALFCGGFSRQYNNLNKGKCGICGDPYDDVRLHEAGPKGKYATGTIVRHFTQGGVMDVTVQLTANHKGYFEFSICSNNNVKKAASEDCFYLLSSTNGFSQFKITSSMGSRKLSYQLQLPSDLICSQCIVRWHYNAGNSWGCDSAKKCDIGLGPQETFRGCADIQIHPSKVGNKFISTNITPTSKTPSIDSITTMEVSPSDTDEPACRAAGLWKDVPGMTEWCMINCFHTPPYCPDTHCSCS